MTRLSPCDYGYRASVRSMKNCKIPKSVFQMARDNIHREVRYAKEGFVKTQQSQYWTGSQDMKRKRHLRNSVAQLRLDNGLVWRREASRDQVDAPKPLYAVYYILCWFIDGFFRDRPIQRFWFLETVARMPYFSYVAILHMYETLGWWSIDSQLRAIHNEEDANEGNHLLIMESLGGNARWSDRFIAHHSAMLYYAVLVVLFLVSPKTAYNSSELLEMHAVDTYSQFLAENEDALRSLPPPLSALEYYNARSATASRGIAAGPDAVENLYDVFEAICSDERVHADSMRVLKNTDAL